jgi:hypothetical protein
LLGFFISSFLFFYFLAFFLLGKIPSGTKLQFDNLGMDVDPAPGSSCVGAEAAIAAARRVLALGQQNSNNTITSLAPAPASAATTTLLNHVAANCDTKTQVIPSADPGGLFKQCSNAKLAKSFVDLTSFSTGTGTVYEPVSVPRIGSMIIEDETNLSKLYHGARMMRNGKLANDVITSTFDPATLH